MSVSQSNLSDPKYGYDLVVAVTQASVNATMKEFLAGITSPEVIGCYVYDENNDIVPIDYDKLKLAAGGSDPFGVPDGANVTTNSDLVNLSNANFAGAFRAQIGLPDLPLASLPPVVTLSPGSDAPAAYNLLCSEFVVVGFNYGRKTTWINQSQPTSSEASPWYFSSNVKLNPAPVDPNDKNVSPAVQQRISQLLASAGEGAFSIQQLLVDLDTVMLESVPTFVGVPEGWPVATL
jgi:hypothetical protein